MTWSRIVPRSIGYAASRASSTERWVAGPATLGAVLDALEARYPMLRGTIRDRAAGKRRAFIRFFACEQDLSNDPPDTPLPAAVVSGSEPFLVVGAMAGG